MPEELLADDIDWGRMLIGTQTPHPDTTYTPELNPDDIDPDFIAYIPFKAVGRKPKPAQKRKRKPRVTQVPGKQEFYQKPIDIGAEAARSMNMSGFNFDTRPFKAFEAMTPQEKLQLARERGTPGIRQATAAERAVTDKLNAREAAVRKRREGPSLFGMVEPMRELGEAHQTLTYETPNVFLKGLAALPEGAAEILIQKPLFDKSTQDNRPILPSLRRFTDYAGEVIEDAFPTDPKGNLSPVAQTLGSAAQFVIPGKLLTKLGVPTKATAGIVGSSSNVQQIAREMDKFKDVTPERRDAAIAMAAATGLTEMIGLGRAIDKLGLRQEFTRRLIDISEEGGQEVLQQWLNNLNAKVVGAYDKNRPLTKDLMMSFMMGTMGGAMFQGMSMAAERDRQRPPGTPPPPAQRWQPQNMQATQMELPFPPDVEEIPVPRPDDQQPGLGLRINNEPTMVDLGTGFGETARVFPRTQSAYGESEGQIKVGKRGRRPQQKSIMPTEEERLLDVEGGFSIPIPSKEEWDAPEQFPLTDKIRADRPSTQEVLKNTDPMTGLPLAAVDMSPQDSMERREDNLLEFLRDSQAFYRSGDPMIGYYPSASPSEHNIISEIGSHFGDTYGRGMDIYQDPDLASYFSENRSFTTQIQDDYDHPYYKGIYKEEYDVALDKYLFEKNKTQEELTPYELDRIKEDAQVEARRIVGQTFIDQVTEPNADPKYLKSPNVRPFYMDVRDAFRMEEYYGVEMLYRIREALRKKLVDSAYGEEKKLAASMRADEFARIEEEEILAGVRPGTLELSLPEGIEPGIYGHEIYDLLNRFFGGTIDEKPSSYGNQLRDRSQDFKVTDLLMDQGGFDALVYTSNASKPKEFKTMEEADAYADKVGGKVVLYPVQLEAERWVYDQAGGMIKAPPVMSKGPTVIGSSVWKIRDGSKLKSSTGNTGDFDPNRKEVWASASPQGWERADTSSDTLAFDVMPGLTPKQAPYLRLPQWAMNAITGKTNIYGYNLPFESLTKALTAIEKAAPDSAHKETASQALMDLAVQSKVGANISSLSLVSNEGQEEESEGSIRGTIEHELFHAAQREGAMPDPQWAEQHPIVQKIIAPGSFLRKQNPNDSDSTLAIRAAMEIPTHTIHGKLHLLGLSSAEGIDFLMDYYTHLLETKGKGGIEAIRRVSGRLRPAMVEALDLAESMWEGWQATNYGTQGFLGELAAAEPDIEVDSAVRSKSRGKVGIVTNMGTDEDGRWAEVRFSDGSIEEVYLKDLSIVPASKTPKVPNKTKAQQELKNDPVISVMGSGQMFLPGMEGSRRDVVATPPVPPNLPPSQPMLPGMFGPEYPSVMVEQVSNVYNQAVDRAFTALLEANGVRFNPTQDVFLQVADAIAEGKIDGKRFQEALAENGLTREQFVDRFKATTSDSARTLAYLSHVKQRWLKAMSKNEALKDVLFTPGELFEMLLKDINNTELGMSLWQRASTIVRMLMLSDIHTAAVNSIMTAGRIPLAIGVHGGGAWLKTMADGRAQGKTLAQNLNDATDASLDAMKAGLEVLLVMNPVDIAKAAIGRDSRQGHHEAMVNELFKAFPDLKHKLKDPGIGTDKPAELGNMLKMAENIVEDIRTKPARQKALTDLKLYQKRFNSNVKGIGNLLKGPEVVLDWILTPMRWQEWFFRRPMFIGYLDLALRRQNMNSLEDLMRDDQLKSIPEDVLEAAIDEALDFTYAYMPKIDGPGLEKSAYHLIKGINELKGASSIIGTMFPRAVYNGMKFTYEYSPAGALPGLKKMLRPEYQTDPKDNAQFRTNPLTQKDYDRFAKATLGTIMFAGALSLLKYGLTGDEWWQIKTGRKHPDGRPIYLDIRRYQPFATFYRLADLTDRLLTSSGVWKGDRRLGDLQFGKELKETLTGLRAFPGMEEYLSALADLWTDGDAGNVEEKAKSSVGMGLAYLTRPLINLRHAVAMFDEDENKRRDLKGTGIIGPLVDNIPWVRRLLPEYQSITEPSPPQIYQDPELLMMGAKYTVGEGYAGREWRRLGFLNRRFMPPDPNPKINRLQNEFFRSMIYDLGQAAESDPSYQQMNDVDRAAYWERIAQKVAPAASKFGLTADPKEAVKRKVRDKANVGDLQFKSMGLDKMLQDGATPKPDQQEVERLSRQAVQ